LLARCGLVWFWLWIWCCGFLTSVLLASIDFGGGPA